MKRTVQITRIGFALFLLVLLCLPLTFTALPAQADTHNTTDNLTVTPPKETNKNARDGHVVLIMTSGLQWESINDYNAPRLRELAASGAIGNLVPLAAKGPSCPINSWMTLSAGTKLSLTSLAFSKRCDCPPVIPGTRVGYYERIRHISTFEQDLYLHKNLEDYGTFSSALQRGNITNHAIGTGAGYVLTTQSDTYPYSWEEAPRSNEQLAQSVEQSALTYNLTVVDADIARTITEEDYPTSPDDTNLETTRKNYRHQFFEQQAQLNAERVEAILERIPDGTRVVVASLMSREDRHTQLFVVGDVGDTSATFSPVVPGLLYSASVRREGALQLTDIDPTILSWFSSPRPESMTGASLIDNRLSGTSTCTPEQACFTKRVDTLVDDSSLFTLVRDVRYDFLAFFHYSTVLFFLATMWLTLIPICTLVSGRRLALRTLWMWIGYTLSSFSLATLITNLFHWWRAESPLAVYSYLSWGCAALFGLLALLSRRIHRLAPLFIILVPTALFITIDTATGSRIMADSAVGFNTLAAARFYGIGNEAYALLAASSLFILAFLGVWVREKLKDIGRSAFVARTVAIGVVGILGLTIAAIDALPQYGADFGGALSYIPALLVMLVLLSETRVTLSNAVLITGATVLLAVLIAFVDWLRPASSRTHLGNFFQSVLDGKFSSIVSNKLATNISLLETYYTAIVFFGLLLLFIVILPALSTYKSESFFHKKLYAQEIVSARSSGNKLALLWARLKFNAWQSAYALYDMHSFFWSCLFMSKSEKSATQRWPALKIALVVEFVVFILAFALNDSGIVLPAMAVLLLIPMLTSLTIDELSPECAENVTSA